MRRLEVCTVHKIVQSVLHPCYCWVGWTLINNHSSCSNQDQLAVALPGIVTLICLPPSGPQLEHLLMSS